MNANPPREQLERAMRLAQEMRRRKQRALHASRGWIDENGVLQGGLMQFMRDLWPVLEPEAPLIEGWPLYAIVQHLEAVAFNDLKRLLINVPPGFAKSITSNVFFPAWVWGALKRPSCRFLTFSYSASLTERDNEKFRDLCISPTYQSLYGDVVKLSKIGSTLVSNTKTGWKRASSVGGVTTGMRADIILADDLHSVKEAESDTVRSETTRWFRESMINRLNNMEESAIIVIMQRVHEYDTAGVILSEDMGYEHLNVPNEYEWQRHCTTSLGWHDPRGLDDDGEPLLLFDEETGERFPRDEEAARVLEEDRDGELAWPERFPPHVVERLKHDIGPYAYCTPAESPILMADLSMKPIGDVRIGDEVLGFTIDSTPRRAGEVCSRRFTKPAQVVAVSRSVRPVVKVTLDSGRVVRCTADHKWYTGRSVTGSHKVYKKAQVGGWLLRVCDPELPKLETPEDHHLSGWLAGFFDGDGSASLQARHDGGRSRAQILFYQGDGRNLPICEKLERALDHFGFEWSCKQVIRSDRKTPAKHKNRVYRLSGRNIPLMQKFLHVVKPVKWRERLIQNAETAKFIIGEERVISIEEDGTEPVYGLTTTTGNYVVWGLASSNSGQYQQAPTPRGGGIFQRAWWQPWERDSYPEFSFILASLDTAFTEKEQNDPSALTVWGVFDGPDGMPKTMLIDAWRKRLEMHGSLPLQMFGEKDVRGQPNREYLARCEMVLPRQPRESDLAYYARVKDAWGLVEWVAYTCRRMRVNRLIIENKTGGITAAQELQRIHGMEGYGIELHTPHGDKVARALAVQPIFSQGMVFAPPYEFAETVIQEMENFPRGRYKDLTDSSTQAVKWLRDNGFADRPEELRFQEDQRRQLRRASKPLYGVR